MTVAYASPEREAATRITTGRIRLTKRGRVVFGLLGALLILGALSAVAMFVAPNASASADESNVSFGYVTVPAGASLWNIAAKLDPTSDPRDVIAEIVNLNQLSSSNVWAGDVLAVPLEYREAPGVLSASQIAGEG